MEEAYVRLRCPDCTKEWQSNPAELPASRGRLSCPSCESSARVSEFARTEHDLRTLKRLG